jgi:hypothetical protein
MPVDLYLTYEWNCLRGEKEALRRIMPSFRWRFGGNVQLSFNILAAAECPDRSSLPVGIRY